MRAAAYVRKSTSDERSAEDGRSVERQIEGAKTFAKKKGWDLVEIFTDEKQSGAEFLNRPGLTKLREAVKAKAFDVLIIWEQSRLGRDTFRTVSLIQEIEEAGIAIVSYVDGRPITAEGEMGEVETFMKGWADKKVIRDGSRRTREALEKKAARGHSAGARTYGYDLVRKGEHTERVKNEKQVAIVQRVFEMAAAGEGDRNIVRALRKDGITELNRIRIQRMLANETYLGRQVFGKTKSVTAGGAAGAQVTRDKSEWIVTEIPGLRIISDALWEKVRARKNQTAAAYAKGKAKDTPTGLKSKYLLSGIGRCGECGAAFTVSNVTKGRDKVIYAYYICSRRSDGGVCSNAKGVPMSALDSLIRKAVVVDLFSDHARLDTLLTEYYQEQRRLRESARKASPNPEVEIKRLEKEIGRLVNAIASGAGSAALGAAVAEKEARITVLKAIGTPTPEPTAVSGKDLLMRLWKDMRFGGQPLTKVQLEAGWLAWQQGLRLADDAFVRRLLGELGVTRIAVHRRVKGWEIEGMADLSNLLGSGTLALPREPSPRHASSELLKLPIHGWLLDEAAAEAMKSNPSSQSPARPGRVKVPEMTGRR